jgi:hypothetical protein
MAMIRKSVDSTNLKKVGYDRKTKELEITFQNGRVYVYDDVPEEVFKELLDADSKGRYFNSEIRDDYQYYRVK